MALFAVSLPAPAAAQGVSRAVGMVVRQYADTERHSWSEGGPRPVVTTIWYPAAGAPAMDTVGIGPPAHRLFIAGVAARGAPLAARPRRLPLVLLSHGTGGSALQLMWLGQALAARGYLVAAVNHHGNTGAEPVPVPQGFLLWWERPRDLSVALDAILTDSLFAGRVDTARIGAAGFSIGGYTVIELAGARTDLAAYAAFCRSAPSNPMCRAPPELLGLTEDVVALERDPRVQASRKRAGDSYRDPRIKAIVAIAPAQGIAFTRAGLREVRVPVSLIVGDADSTAPARDNTLRFRVGIGEATLMTLPGVGHYTFLGECTPFGRSELPFYCTDLPNVSRARVHAQVSGMVIRFFDTRL